MGLKKVCIVAPIHIWDDVRVFKKQAVSLATHGYDVTLIAKMPHELDQCTIDGVKLNRSKIAALGKIGRIVCIYKVFIQALESGADVYHLHNPNTIPIVFLLRLFSKKVIYDTHEDYSKRLLFREWIPKRLRSVACKVVSTLEWLTANVTNRAIGTQDSVVKRLGKKAVLIGNSPRFNQSLIDRVQELKSEVSLKNDCFRLVYLGTINEPRGITDIVNSLELVNKERQVRLCLIGEISSNYLEALKALPGWKYVDFTGRLNQELAFAYVAQSDIGLIYIHDVGDHSSTDPNKLFEYMSFSKPYIASDFSSWKGKLEASKSGVFVKPAEPKLLAEAVARLAENKDELEKMGINGQLFVKSNNWEIEFLKLADIYSEIV